MNIKVIGKRDVEQRPRKKAELSRHKTDMSWDGREGERTRKPEQKKQKSNPMQFKEKSDLAKIK